MIGNYRMMDWEREKYTKFFSARLEKIRNGAVKEQNITDIGLCPSNVDTILSEHLGYDWEGEDDNNHDFWYIWHHPDDPDNLFLYLQINLDTFEMYLFFEESD